MLHQNGPAGPFFIGAAVFHCRIAVACIYADYAVLIRPAAGFVGIFALFMPVIGVIMLISYLNYGEIRCFLPLPKRIVLLP